MEIWEKSIASIFLTRRNVERAENLADVNTMSLLYNIPGSKNSHFDVKLHQNDYYDYPTIFLLNFSVKTYLHVCIPVENNFIYD